uniref:Uncharacterized protein n=2 Tax=Physcomitrium patens TaxID=3218 RepID=A0A7I4AM28_PHYPA
MVAGLGNGFLSSSNDLLNEPKNVCTSKPRIGDKSLQTLIPIQWIHAQLRVFLFYARINQQEEVHHYWIYENQETRQCLMDDIPETNAHLIGIEYIISTFWHILDYEIKAGNLFTAGVPALAQNKELYEEQVSKPYYKESLFWQSDRVDTLSVGLPRLMMFTEDDQLNLDLLPRSTRVLWSSRYLSPTTNAATLAQPSVGNTKAGGLCIWLGVHTGSRPWIHILRLLLLNTNAATNAHAQMQLCVTSTQDHESALMCARALRPTSQVMEPRHPASCNFCTGSMLIFTLH